MNLSGTVKLDGGTGVTLEPPFERDDAQCPTECQTCYGDSDVQEHHHIIMTLPHRCDRQFFG